MKLSRPGRLRVTVVAAVVATWMCVVAPSTPASAAASPGNLGNVSVGCCLAGPSATCEFGANGYGDHCVHWGQNYDGSHSGIWQSTVPDFPVTGSTHWVYMSAGTGQGQYIGNNNGSNQNLDRICQLRLFYDPGYGTPSVTLGTYGSSTWQKQGGGLGTLLNNIRSHHFCI